MSYLELLPHEQLIACLRKLESNAKESGDVAAEMAIETAIYRLEKHNRMGSKPAEGPSDA